MLFLGKLIVQTILVCLIHHSQLGEAAVERAKSPLILTRKRHDLEFLQASRIYQQNLPLEEVELERWLKVNLTNEASELHELKLSYYINDKIKANEITHDHLIVGALHRAYTSKVYTGPMYTYDNKDDRRRASDKRLVSKERCKRELQYLVDNLLTKRKLVDPELAAFYDNHGRTGDGLLYGNIHWQSLPRECGNRLIVAPDHQNQSNSLAFSGRYCTASIKSSKWDPFIREQRDKLIKANNFFKYEGQAYDYERFFRIHVGLCLPQSCDSETIDWAHHQIKELVMHPLVQPYNTYDLIDLFCLPDETSELRQLEPMGKLLVWLLVAWFATIMVATYFDREQEELAARKSGWHKFVWSMSIKRNWQRLTGLRESPEPDLGRPACSDTLFLNFLKVFFVPLIIMAHHYMLYYEVVKYGTLMNQPYYRFIAHFTFGGVFLVSAFFMITGFATSYTLLCQKSSERYTWKQWFHFLLHRYWRLAPLYLLIFWFNKHLFMYTNSGPNWDYGTSNVTRRSICRAESWWYPLTMTSFHRPIHDECVMTSWYASNDMWFALVVPLALVGLSKWPRLAWRVGVATIFISTYLRFHNFVVERRISHLDLMRVRHDFCIYNTWASHLLYQFPQYRIGTYLIGLLAGHYAYMVKSGQWSSVLYTHPNFKQHHQRNKFLHQSIFISGLIMFISCFLGTIILEYLPLPRSLLVLKLLASLFYTTPHPFSSLGLTLIFLLLIFGHFPRLRWFMSRPIWGLLSKLNYSLLLVQGEVIWYLFQSQQQGVNDVANDFLFRFFGFYLVCLLLSIILNLTLELPLAQLEHEFITPLFALPKAPKAVHKQQDGLDRKQE